MKGSLTRITLPRRKALSATLATLRLNHKNFSKTSSRLMVEISQVRKLFLSKELTEFLIKIRDVEPDVKYLVKHNIVTNNDYFGGFFTMKDYVKLAELIGNDSLSLLSFGETVFVGLGVAVDFVSTFKNLNEIECFFHLLPEPGELDPDQCTCATTRGLEQPCQKIANHIVKMKNRGVITPALGVVTGGHSSLAFILHRGYESFKILSKGGETESELFLKDKSLVAEHLRNAAQTYGSTPKPAAAPKARAHYFTQQDIPEINIRKYGCPKAISVIACLFGEYHRDTQYVKTIATIIGCDGATIIKQQL